MITQDILNFRLNFRFDFQFHFHRAAPSGSRARRGRAQQEVLREEAHLVAPVRFELDLDGRRRRVLRDVETGRRHDELADRVAGREVEAECHVREEIGAVVGLLGLVVVVALESMFFLTCIRTFG